MLYKLDEKCHLILSALRLRTITLNKLFDHLFPFQTFHTKCRSTEKVESITDQLEFLF